MMSAHCGRRERDAESADNAESFHGNLLRGRTEETMEVGTDDVKVRYKVRHVTEIRHFGRLRPAHPCDHVGHH